MAVYLLVAFLLAAGCTWLARRFAVHFGILDRPDSERKKHRRPIPLLGGVALFVSFWALVAFVALYAKPYGITLLNHKLWAVFCGSVILMVLGICDDKRSLSPWLRLGITALAVLVTILGGLHLDKVTNPFGGVLTLESGRIATPWGPFFAVADVLVFVWLMGMMYTTKLLDGLDGLATGVVAIGSLIIFCLTMTKAFYQPNVGLLALILAGCCLGFLLFNFSSATIFLGEAGSLFIGFMLGVLAIISGGKVATAFLVLAVPILDVLRVMYLRFRHGQSVFKGDRRHLHFALLDKGLSERQVVLFFYLTAAVFGSAALFLQTSGKLLALGAILLVMVLATVRLQLTSK